MNIIDTLIANPIAEWHINIVHLIGACISGIITALLVSVLFHILIKRKEKREQAIKEATKIIEDVCVFLNDTLSCLFWYITEENNVVSEKDIHSAIRNIYKIRYKFKIKVKEYFKKSKRGIFESEYFLIIKEMDELRISIEHYFENKQFLLYYLLLSQ